MNWWVKWKCLVCRVNPDTLQLLIVFKLFLPWHVFYAHARARKAPQRRPLLINHPREPALGSRVLLLKAKPSHPFIPLSEGVELTSPFFRRVCSLSAIHCSFGPRKRTAAVAFSRFLFRNVSEREFCGNHGGHEPRALLVLIGLLRGRVCVFNCSASGFIFEVSFSA